MALSCSKKAIYIIQRNNIKRHDDFYWLNCLNSFRTENKLKFNEKVCENKDFYGIVMPSEKDNILDFNQYMSLDKMQYKIYADIESLIKKIDGCGDNPKNSSTAKISDHILYVADIQYEEVRHLVTQKTNILYFVEQIV